MKPLPKWVAYLSLLGVIGTGATSIVGIVPTKWSAIVGAAAALINAVTHSLQGSGGTVNNP